MKKEKLFYLTQYYINKYNLNNKSFILNYDIYHNLKFLISFDSSLFLDANLDEDHFKLSFPKDGLIYYDYERILELDLSDKNDLEEFRYLGANLIKIIYDYPEKCKFLQQYLHFNQVIEFLVLESYYEYFDLNIENLLLVLSKYNYINAVDCGFITYARLIIEKTRNLKDFKPWKKIILKIF